MDTDVHELAGAYAVDALPDHERQFFERHLSDCASCGEEVAGFHEAVATLGSASEQDPPAGMRQRVLAAAAVTDQVPATGRDAPTGAHRVAAAGTPGSRLARLRTLVPAVAAAVVLLGGLAVVAVELGTPGPSPAEEQLAEVMAEPDARTVELDAPPGATARFSWSPARGTGVFVSGGLGAAPDGHAYALWLIDDTAAALTGLLRPDADGDVAHAVTDGLDGVVTVAVTVEPADAAGEGPTTDPIIVGNL